MTPEQRAMKYSAESDRIEYLTGSRLAMVVNYDPETGEVLRVFNSRRKQCTEPCGTIDDDGYLVIYIDRIRCTGHQIAWAWMTGKWPTHEIDHEDTDRANNRWSNLRAATRQQNAANMALSVANKSGFKGVFWDEQNQKWRAGITVNSRWIHLGRYAKLEDAADAYEAAAKKHFGEFARTA
jgi:hypothetical protein